MWQRLATISPGSTLKTLMKTHKADSFPRGKKGEGEEPRGIIGIGIEGGID